MTPEAQRIAIAEACGWKRSDHIILGNWVNPADGKHHALPNYLNDLNAINSAIQILNEQQRREFALWLTAVTREGTYFPTTYDELFPAIMATAAQRAEAFLRAIGKWID